MIKKITVWILAALLLPIQMFTAVAAEDIIVTFEQLQDGGTYFSNYLTNVKINASGADLETVTLIVNDGTSDVFTKTKPYTGAVFDISAVSGDELTLTAIVTDASGNQGRQTIDITAQKLQIEWKYKYDFENLSDGLFQNTNDVVCSQEQGFVKTMTVSPEKGKSVAVGRYAEQNGGAWFGVYVQNSANQVLFSGDIYFSEWQDYTMYIRGSAWDITSEDVKFRQNGTIQLAGTEQTVPFTAKEWHHFEYAVNLPQKTYTFVFDGKPVAVGLPMANQKLDIIHTIRIADPIQKKDGESFYALDNVQFAAITGGANVSVPAVSRKIFEETFDSWNSGFIQHNGYYAFDGNPFTLTLGTQNIYLDQLVEENLSNMKYRLYLDKFTDGKTDRVAAIGYNSDFNTEQGIYNGDPTLRLRPGGGIPLSSAEKVIYETVVRCDVDGFNIAFEAATVNRQTNEPGASQWPTLKFQNNDGKLNLYYSSHNPNMWLGNWNQSQEMKLAIVLDMATSKFDFYVDGILRLQGAEFVDPKYAITSINTVYYSPRFADITDADKLFYIDDIKVYAGNYIMSAPSYYIDGVPGDGVFWEPGRMKVSVAVDVYDNRISLPITLMSAVYDEEQLVEISMQQQTVSVSQRVETSLDLENLGDTVSVKFFTWDTLEQMNPMLKPVNLFCKDVGVSTEDLTIYLVGDSICADYSWRNYGIDPTPTGDWGAYPMQGWGYYLQKFFNDNVTVENKAINGRSTRSFIDEGRWDGNVKPGYVGDTTQVGILDTIEPGDYVFVSMGHNDMNFNVDSNNNNYVKGTTIEEYKDYLRRYVDDTRAARANIIFVTSIQDVYGARNSLLERANAMKEVALEKNVTLLDINGVTYDHFSELGLEETRKTYFMDYDVVLSLVGEQRIPLAWSGPIRSGESDYTHLTYVGAEYVAKTVAELLKESDNSLKTMLK